MGKNLNGKNLRGRSLLAVSLAASLAAFGCTTNQNLGNGAPVRSGGELRSAPTSGVTSGQERMTPPPMTSSYTRAEVLPAVTPRQVSRADRAAAIMAQHQAARGRYLGPANPGAAGRAYVSDAMFPNLSANPALLTNPQITVNSSISSPPVPVAGVGGGNAFVAGFTNGGAFTSGATATGTTGATSGAFVAGAATTPTATTSIGGTLPAGAFAAPGRFTPTESIVANPTVTAASVGAGRDATGTTLNTAVGTTGTTTTGAATPAAAAVTNATAGGAGAVRLIRAGGSPLITNTATPTTTAASSGRSQ